MPKGAEEGIRKGLYKFETVEAKGNKGRVQLLGSGAIFRHVREAAQILANEYGVSSDVYSVPSFTEVAREGAGCRTLEYVTPNRNATRTLYRTSNERCTSGCSN